MRKSVLKRKRVGRFGNELQNVAKEIAVWKKLSHPNVLQCIEVIDDPEFDKIYLISEIANGGACMPNEVTCQPLDRERAKRWSSMMVSIDTSALHCETHTRRFLAPEYRGLLTSSLLPSLDARVRVFALQQCYPPGREACKSFVTQTKWRGSYQGNKRTRWCNHQNLA